MSAPEAGDWVVNGRTATGWRIDDLGAGREGVAFLMNPVAIVPKEEDAHRIAALPDLLEALERTASEIGSLQAHAPATYYWDALVSIHDKIRAAISKASGR